MGSHIVGVKLALSIMTYNHPLLHMIVQNFGKSHCYSDKRKQHYLVLIAVNEGARRYKNRNRLKYFLFCQSNKEIVLQNVPRQHNPDTITYEKEERRIEKENKKSKSINQVILFVRYRVLSKNSKFTQIPKYSPKKTANPAQHKKINKVPT